jgi:hypothetical protein
MIGYGVAKESPVPGPLRPPQIQYRRIWDLTRASAVRAIAQLIFRQTGAQVFSFIAKFSTQNLYQTSWDKYIIHMKTPIHNATYPT